MAGSGQKTPRSDTTPIAYHFCDSISCQREQGGQSGLNVLHPRVFNIWHTGLTPHHDPSLSSIRTSISRPSGHVGLPLTDDDLSSFIAAWHAAFDETLTPELAEKEAKRLIHFFLTLAEERVDLAGLSRLKRGTMAA